jgi:hypothetical protein
MEPINFLYKTAPICFIMASHIKNYGTTTEAELDDQISDILSRNSESRVRFETNHTLAEQSEVMNQSDVQQLLLA